MHLGSWQFSPYSKVSAANTSLKAFSESGGATALTHNKQKLKDTSVAIGLDIHSQITRNTRSIKPFAKIEYNESSSKTTASMHYNSEDASTYTYTKRFDKKNKHWKLKLGLDLNTESGWNSSASYTREQSFGSSDDSQTSDSFSLNAVLRF
jgi:outer membrane autotransporter protein